MFPPRHLAAWAVLFTTSTVVESVEPPIAARAPTTAVATQVVLGTAIGGALDPLATRPPVAHPGGSKVLAAGNPDLTINIVNSFGEPLSIFYGSNAGGPSPVGDPGPGTLTSSTQILCPSDWAGRITIGGNYDPRGSKIEASYVPPDYVPDVDVSFVDGYSVPITCSCSEVPVTGCNVELFQDGHTCDDLGPGPICYNPAVEVPHGPPPAFFSPCQGAAYTYPYDDGANSYGQCGTQTIDCCVGPQCPAPARQPQQPGKREWSSHENSLLRFWPSKPFTVPILGSDWFIEPSDPFLLFQIIDHRHPFSTRQTNLLSAITKSQIKIYEAAGAGTSPHPFRHTREDVRFEMELMPTTVFERLKMNVAIDALTEFGRMVEAQGGVGLEFLICNGRGQPMAKLTVKDTGWEGGKGMRKSDPAGQGQ